MGDFSQEGNDWSQESEVIVKDHMILWRCITVLLHVSLLYYCCYMYHYCITIATCIATIIVILHVTLPIIYLYPTVSIIPWIVSAQLHTCKRLCKHAIINRALSQLSHTYALVIIRCLIERHLAVVGNWVRSLGTERWWNDPWRRYQIVHQTVAQHYRQLIATWHVKGKTECAK